MPSKYGRGTGYRKQAASGRSPSSGSRQSELRFIQEEDSGNEQEGMEIQESISPARETEILSAHGMDAEIIPTQLIMNGDMQSIMPVGVEQRARIGEDASQPNVPRSVETAQPRAASAATACLPRSENFSSDHLAALDAKT